MRITKVTPGPGDTVRVHLDPPVMAEITADRIVLFDGGDAGRVLWRSLNLRLNLRSMRPGTRPATTAK